MEDLLDQLIRLPGIGRRSAERIVFWLLNQPAPQAEDLAGAIVQLKKGLKFCQACNNLSEQDVCLICSDPGRDNTILCIVEEPKDLLAIERTGTYRGHYHVLLGTISPAEGKGPEDLKIRHLLKRLDSSKIREVVIATDPDAEGETTALYLAQELKNTGVQVSRIGLGIPIGSSLEYADLSTLSISMASRRQME